MQTLIKSVCFFVALKKTTTAPQMYRMRYSENTKIKGGDWMTIRKGRCMKPLLMALAACCMIFMFSSVAYAEESPEPEETVSTENSLAGNGVEVINEAYDYTIDTEGDSVGASAGISQDRGWVSLGSEMSYMKFPEGMTAPDGSDGLWCYCLDISTNTKDGHKYSITTLDAADYYDEAAADKIRSILLNSYPNMTIEELAAKYGLEDLMEEEAFMATQWILWYYSNPDGLVSAGGGSYYPADLYKPSEYPKDTMTMWYDDADGNETSKKSSNIVKLAKALDALAPAAAYETEPAEIIFNKTIYDDRAVFDYGDSVGAETLENVKITVKDGQGNEVPFALKGTKVVVMLEDIAMADGTAELTVSLAADQMLAKDVYFFSPEGGRDASQSRVSAYEGLAPVAKEAIFALTKEEFEEGEKAPEEPEDPVIPEEPEDPDDPNEPNEPNDPTEPGRQGDGAEEAPETGDGIDLMLLFVVMMMTLGLAGVVVKRERQV